MATIGDLDQARQELDDALGWLMSLAAKHLTAVQQPQYRKTRDCIETALQVLAGYVDDALIAAEAAD